MMMKKLKFYKTKENKIKKLIVSKKILLKEKIKKFQVFLLIIPEKPKKK